MLVLRLLFILSALAIALSVAVFLYTKNRGYLDLAWQIARFLLFVYIMFAALYILERYLLTGWRFLL